MKHAHLLGPPYDPRYGPTVGSYEGGVSYERGTPVASYLPVLTGAALFGGLPRGGRIDMSINFRSTN